MFAAGVFVSSFRAEIACTPGRRARSIWYNARMETRLEHDLVGDLEVPADGCRRIHSERIHSPQEMTHPGIAGLHIMETNE